MHGPLCLGSARRDADADLRGGRRLFGQVAAAVGDAGIGRRGFDAGDAAALPDLRGHPYHRQCGRPTATGWRRTRFTTWSGRTRRAAIIGVAEIRDDNAILMDRLAELKRQRRSRDKINFHSPDEMKYGFPKTVNWDRDGAVLGPGRRCRAVHGRTLSGAPPAYLRGSQAVPDVGVGSASRRCAGILLILFGGGALGALVPK